jgi:hypothetical protein
VSSISWSKKVNLELIAKATEKKVDHIYGIIQDKDQWDKLFFSIRSVSRSSCEGVISEKGARWRISLYSLFLSDHTLFKNLYGFWDDTCWLDVPDSHKIANNQMVDCSLYRGCSEQIQVPRVWLEYWAPLITKEHLTKMVENFREYVK